MKVSSLTNQKLVDLREELLAIDHELIRLLSKRAEISEKIGKEKIVSGESIVQYDRWNRHLNFLLEEAEYLRLKPILLKIFLKQFISTQFKFKKKIVNNESTLYRINVSSWIV